MRKTLSIFLTTIFIFILFSLWIFYTAIRPYRIVSTVTPKTFGVTYENISFRTEDGIRLTGWFIPSLRPHAKTIILLHGYPADKGNILPATIFLQDDYNLLYFDFRYFGESGGAYSTIGRAEILDLLAAIHYLASRGIHEVGIWGFSMGGSIAITAAKKAPQIKAIIAESSFARLDWMAFDYYPLPLLGYPLGKLLGFWTWLFLGYDLYQDSPANAIKTLTIPLLLIHSKQDQVVPFKHALHLQENSKQNPNTTLISTEHEQHGQFMENHESIIKAFFDKNLH